MNAPAILLLGAWIGVVIPWSGAQGAAVVVFLAALALVVVAGAWRNMTLVVLLAALSSSCVALALARHGGFLLLAWAISGGVLTVLVRREGGETAGKPGRILEIQQHVSAVLLLLLMVGIVAATRDWGVSRSASTLATFADRMGQTMAAAGLQRAPRVWVVTSTVLVAAITSLRLGLFPFPFSLRRSARRLQGLSLMALTSVFIPCSIVAIGRVCQVIAPTMGAALVMVCSVLGTLSLVGGALWVQVEWQAESYVGHVAQCYAGLALLGLARGDRDLVTLVLIQGAVATMLGVLWSVQLRERLSTSDLSKVSDGYSRHRELEMLHVGFGLFSCPWPGTPAGQVWMDILGAGIASGTGISVLVLVGVTLLFHGLFRSVGKIRSRLSGGSVVPNNERTISQTAGSF